ncbi:MAG TPA: outer membrane beta-barrel protein [Bauldia sp.]
MRPAFASLVAAIFVAAMLSGAAAENFALRPGIVPDMPDANTDDTSAPPPRRVTAASDPYAALGIRAGGFILYPSLTIGTGFTTNASASAGGTPSGFGTLTPELKILSDWDRNAVGLDLKGSYEDFFDGTTPPEPSASAEGTARIDITDQWTADFAAGATYDEQNVSDPNYPAGADKPPGVIGLTSSADLKGSFGLASFTLGGSADRNIYEDATSLGALIDQGDRNNTDYAGRLRVGYDITPTLTPFVEGEVSRRVYDRTIDNTGLQRSGDGYTLRAGVEIEHDPLLRGEISVGTTHQSFDDPTLAPLDALAFDGTLVWAPTRLTTVTFDGSTSLQPGDLATSSGSILYDASVDVAYAWRDNITIDLTGAIENERFQGIGEVDTTYDAGLSATWKINRTLQLTAGYVHEWMDSSDPTLPYQSDTVKAELRVQR